MDLTRIMLTVFVGVKGGYAHSNMHIILLLID